MLDKFKEEEQTFLSTSPDSSDFEELPPDVPHLVEFLPPSPQEVQRYGPTERAVTLWGHEIACLFPFGDMKMLTLFANMCCAHWLY